MYVVFYHDKYACNLGLSSNQCVFLLWFDEEVILLYNNIDFVNTS